MRYKNQIDEAPKTHQNIFDEIEFLHYVADGNISCISDILKQKNFHESEDLTRLSKDPVTSLKYHFVQITTLISRLCINYGLDTELALCMNDFYISGLDNVTTEIKMEDFFNSMVLDYTERMNTLNKKKLSRNVSDAIEYIRHHTGDSLSLNTVAKALGISSGHLSKEFHKEIGIPVGEYIKNRKIDAAKDMLLLTKLSIMEISCHLSFSSQSHFIQVFREETGMTPGKYRAHYGSVKSDPLNLLQ